MKAWRVLRAQALRVTGLFRHSYSQRAVTAEVEGHLQLHIDDLIRSGVSPREARRVAALQLGGIELTRQIYRERSTVPAADNLIQDVRFALRQLRRSPGFAVTATLMLALGVGASVAIFAFVDAALLKPLPYRDPGRLAAVTESV